jgi:hypothetical protein
MIFALVFKECQGLHQAVVHDQRRGRLGEILVLVADGHAFAGEAPGGFGTPLFECHRHALISTP